MREFVKVRNLEKYCPVQTGESIINHVQSELKRAFNETCPIIECKPPPARGWLKKDTVHNMRQCNRIRYAMKNKAYSEEAYESIKAKLKKLKKWTKFMCKRDRTINDIKKFETPTPYCEISLPRKPIRRMLSCRIIIPSKTYPILNETAGGRAGV